MKEKKNIYVINAIKYLKELLDVTEDQEVADFIGVDNKKLSDWKTAKNIPVDFVNIFREKGWSLDDGFFGITDNSFRQEFNKLKEEFMEFKKDYKKKLRTTT